MTQLSLTNRTSKSIPIHTITKSSLKTLAKGVSPIAAKWAKSSGFSANKGEICLVNENTGEISCVLVGVSSSMDDQPKSAFELAGLSRKLPKGNYHFSDQKISQMHVALAWSLGAYKFDRYKSISRAEAKLVVGDKSDLTNAQRAANAHYLARDLINTPTNDLGPDQLEAAFRSLARAYKAKVKVTKGDALLKNNLPLIHTVGRASDQAPRLLDMTWGKASNPKVTLVGKGVCFDTGGLNIKPGNSMTLMKKDMGGAANVMGLAQMIMDANLPVRLRMLVPAVENSISDNAFRPGDVLESRKGISVEIGNTDAEGRLILADALALADEEKPELLIDMATLTGAARVALGPDLPPYYCDNELFCQQLEAASAREFDPLWRMPLWEPYQSMLSSRIADVNHISQGGFAGSVTAALFLSRFVEKAQTWAHFDVFGWVPNEKPWAQVGGEAQCIRALFGAMTNKFT